MAGVAVAGTLVADIKMIDLYPKKGMLADISSVTYGIGGCVFPIQLFGVKRLDPSIEVKSIGLTGNDDTGAFLKEKLSEYEIDVSLVRKPTAK
ncbi:MAG: hypothetical protein V8S96_04265 [Lachnospiraceae bacterium]